MRCAVAAAAAAAAACATTARCGAAAQLLSLDTPCARAAQAQNWNRGRYQAGKKQTCKKRKTQRAIFFAGDM